MIDAGAGSRKAGLLNLHINEPRSIRKASKTQVIRIEQQESAPFCVCCQDLQERGRFTHSPRTPDLCNPGHQACNSVSQSPSFLSISANESGPSSKPRPASLPIILAMNGGPGQIRGSPKNPRWAISCRDFVTACLCSTKPRGQRRLVSRHPIDFEDSVFDQHELANISKHWAVQTTFGGPACNASLSRHCLACARLRSDFKYGSVIIHRTCPDVQVADEL